MSDWSLAGRAVAITGASGGIGRETALALAREGAHLLLIGRQPARYRNLIEEVAEGGGNADLTEADLRDLGSVAEAGRALAVRDRPPTVLINNAGVTGQGQTNDGFDLAFGVNHLAHYLLTRILLDHLIAASPARILNVSSNAHYGLRDFRWSSAYQPRRSLTGFSQYRHSKAANVAFTFELARRLEGTGVAAVAIHPGLVATGLWRRILPPLQGWVTSRMISPQEGACTTITCAISPSLQPGAYYTPEGIRTPAPYTTDPGTSAGLWTLSEDLVGTWL